MGLTLTKKTENVAVYSGAPLLRGTFAVALGVANGRLSGVEMPDRQALEAELTGPKPPAAVIYLTGGLGKSTAEIIADLMAVADGVPLIVVTPSASIEGVTRTLDAGARGVVTFDESMRELTAAIAFVIDGGVYIPAGALTSGEAGPNDRGWSSIEGGAVGRLMSLTGRQREIVEHVAAGMSNREIAVALGIREGTVKVHVARILEKLGVANRLEAALAVAESRSTGDEVDGAPASLGQMRAARR